MFHGTAGLGLSAQEVTTSDTADNAFDGFFVTVQGNVTYLDLQGNSRVLVAVPVYTLMPFATKKIMATGTTATGIFGVR